MDPELKRFIIAVLAFVLFSFGIKEFVEDPKYQKLFIAILFILCICYVFFGRFLPF